MASITIRDVHGQTVSRLRLRQRAAAHWRSIEEELHVILNDTPEEIEVPAVGLCPAIGLRFAPIGRVNLCQSRVNLFGDLLSG